MLGKYEKMPIDGMSYLFHARYSEVIDGEIWACCHNYYLDDKSHQAVKSEILATAKREFPKSVNVNG
jgi:hypothetical protein